MAALIDLITEEKAHIDLINDYERLIVSKLYEAEISSKEKEQKIREEIRDLEKDVVVGKAALNKCRKNIRLYLLNLFKE